MTDLACSQVHRKREWPAAARLDCGEPLKARICGGVIKRLEPEGVCGYTNLPFREWRRN